MNKLLYIFTFILSILFKDINAQSAYDIIIKNVNIIDVKKGKTVRNQNIYITAEKIVKITKSVNVNNTAQTIIDGTGKYLIPGLWDMHTHNWWNIHFSNHYVNNGVLGVRNMYTPMKFINPLRDSIEKKLINGPKYYAAGRVLEGANPEYPDWIVVDSIYKIKPALDTLQAEGSDFIKVYNKIPREVYLELMKEAKARKMSVQGHLPMAVSAIEASNAGQKSFEHLLGIPDLCTHAHLFANKHNYNWYAAVIKEDDYGTVVINEKLATTTFSVLKKNKTYVCPTLTVWYNLLHPDTPFEKDTLMTLFPNEMTDLWSNMIKVFRLKDSTYKEMALKKYKTLQKVTYLLYKAGVPLLAGTDAMNPFCYPGYSLHSELELLHSCGIPNAEVLKMATYNPAVFLNIGNYGQIKEGHIASVVLLDDNPLEDIRNTKKINTVILSGRISNK